MPGPAGLTYTIGGADRTALVKTGTTHLQDNLSSRNNLDLTLWDDTVNPALRPVVGQPIVLLDSNGTDRLFAGSIDDMDEQLITGKLNYMKYQLRCVDFNQICDRFLVVEAYIDPAQTLSTIVNDIVTNVLAGEGISVAGVNTGPVIAETKIFNYKTVTAVFNELQTLTNFVWWIDYSKVLNFVPRTGAPTSTVLSQANVLSAVIKTSRAIGPYRNVQYVRAGTAETSVRTEHLTGDGKRKTYNVSFGIERGPTRGTDPTITLNGAAQTTGKKGIDTGKAFYWVKGSNELTLDDTHTALSSTDDLSVTYVGRYPSVVEAQLDTEIAARKALEGGTGIYQSLKTDLNLNDIVAQTNLANSLLGRYGFIPQQVQVVTDVTGIRSGQLIQCNFPENNVSGNYLVQSVSAADVDGSFMRYTVTLVNG